MQAPNNYKKKLVMVNYLFKFAPNLSEVTSPMCQLLGKNTHFAWEEPQANAFKRVKDILISNQNQVPIYFDTSNQTNLQVDASKHSLGDSLLQQGKPIVHTSNCSGVQDFYSQYDSTDICSNET